MKPRKFSRSVAKHIRRKKAEIRRAHDDKETQERLIEALLQQFESPRNPTA